MEIDLPRKDNNDRVSWITDFLQHEKKIWTYQIFLKVLACNMAGSELNVCNFRSNSILIITLWGKYFLNNIFFNFKIVLDLQRSCEDSVDVSWLPSTQCALLLTSYINIVHFYN